MTEKDLTAIKLKIDQWAEQCDRDFAARLIDTFLADAPKRLTTLRQAFEQHAQDEFKRAVHTLKSSSGQLGASFYAEVAQRVEIAARDGRMAEMAESVNWLENEFAHLHDALRTLRSGYARAVSG